jgi:hypothetical protein
MWWLENYQMIKEISDGQVGELDDAELQLNPLGGDQVTVDVTMLTQQQIADLDQLLVNWGYLEDGDSIEDCGFNLQAAKDFIHETGNQCMTDANSTQSYIDTQIQPVIDSLEEQLEDLDIELQNLSEDISCTWEAYQFCLTNGCCGC